MNLRERFRSWLDWEIGSVAVPALRQYLRDTGYALYSYVEHDGRWQREVYHPDRGLFIATGRTDRQALLSILAQVWLIESLHAPKVGPT